GTCRQDRRPETGDRIVSVGGSFMIICWSLSQRTCLVSVFLAVASTSPLVACGSGGPEAGASSANATASHGNGSMTAAASCIANKMLSAEITPLKGAAGIDFRGAPSLEEAEAATCMHTGRSTGDEGLASTPNEYLWGPKGEVAADVDYRSHAFVALSLNPGYLGKMTFRSRDAGAFGAHSYVISPDSPILRDGQPLALDWSS